MTGSFKKILLAILLVACSLLLVAQQDVSVVLRINDQQKLGVYHDQPLVISLSISNPKASGYEQWNRLADNAGKKPFPVYFLGSPSMPAWKLVQFHWIKDSKELEMNIEAKLFRSGNAPAELVLDANAWYFLQWGINRAATLQLKPGKYSLGVVIGNYRSNTVELEIKPMPIPVSTLNTEAMQMVLGRFALLYERPDSAIIHAKKTLSLNPASIDALVLSGEAYIQARDYAAALKYFETALTYFNKQFPHSHEPPLYILEMIEWLKVVRKKPN